MFLRFKFPKIRIGAVFARFPAACFWKIKKHIWFPDVSNTDSRYTPQRIAERPAVNHTTPEIWPVLLLVPRSFFVMWFPFFQFGIGLILSQPHGMSRAFRQFFAYFPKNPFDIPSINGSFSLCNPHVLLQVSYKNSHSVYDFFWIRVIIEIIT